MYRVSLIAVISITLLLAPFSAYAQDSAADPAVELLQENVAVSYAPPVASAEKLVELPSVWVLPGSLLYWFKHLYEDIQLALTSAPAERSELLLQLGQARLAEGYQLMQEGKWDNALEALEHYQGSHEDLAAALEKMPIEDAQFKKLLERLKDQLGIQRALDGYVESNAPFYARSSLQAILQLKDTQTLALVRADHGALLGEHVEQASPSATVEASPSATPSATPKVGE